MQVEETGQEVSLMSVEGCVKRYAAERDRLHDEVQLLTDQITALKRRALPLIKRAVARTAERHAELKAMVASAPHLFVKPRTVIFHGVKVGLQKGKGGIDWEDDAHVCALIRKHFSKAQAEVLIKVTEKPIAKALEELPVSDLKRIGCTVEETGDEVVIRATDSEVEKVVKALLADAVEEGPSRTGQ